MPERTCLCRLMESAGGERDSYGHPTKTPREVAKFWASITQLSASKLQSFQQQYPTATHEVETVYIQSIKPDPSMWIVYQGRDLFILSVENVGERNQAWKFICSEQVKVREGDKE